MSDGMADGRPYFSTSLWVIIPAMPPATASQQDPVAWPTDAMCCGPLGDAARLLIETLHSADGPLTAQELADRVGRHHTAVRPRLAALTKAGMVDAVIDAPRGRGRPVTRYAIASLDATESADAHHRLMEVVDDVARSHGFGADDMERFGEGQGHSLAEAGGEGTEVRRRLAALGFAPRTVPGCPGVLELGRCPVSTLVDRPGGRVCRLHRGLAQGLAVRAGLAGADLEVASETRMHCRVILHHRPPEPPHGA